jgi:hypothetical protein
MPVIWQCFFAIFTAFSVLVLLIDLVGRAIAFWDIEKPLIPIERQIYRLSWKIKEKGEEMEELEGKGGEKAQANLANNYNGMVERLQSLHRLYNDAGAKDRGTLLLGNGIFYLSYRGRENLKRKTIRKMQEARKD